jgi:hypothetical protein
MTLTDTNIIITVLKYSQNLNRIDEQVNTEQ